MKTGCRSFIICKRSSETVFTDRKKCREVKTTQYYIPEFNWDLLIKSLKILLAVFLLAAVCTGKIKEVAPILSYILEQLH